MNWINLRKGIKSKVTLKVNEIFISIFLTRFDVGLVEFRQKSIFVDQFNKFFSLALLGNSC